MVYGILAWVGCYNDVKEILLNFQKRLLKRIPYDCIGKTLNVKQIFYLNAKVFYYYKLSDDYVNIE